MPKPLLHQVQVRFTQDEWAQIAHQKKSSESDAALVKRRALESVHQTTPTSFSAGDVKKLLSDLEDRITSMEDSHTESRKVFRQDLVRFFEGFQSYTRAVLERQAGERSRSGR